MAAWSQRQRELLAAMGYPLYRRAATATAGGSAREAALQAAVLAAAGLAQLSAHEREAVWAELELPPPSRLRADPVLKRALWPRLRARRRTRGAP